MSRLSVSTADSASWLLSEIPDWLAVSVVSCFVKNSRVSAMTIVNINSDTNSSIKVAPCSFLIYCKTMVERVNEISLPRYRYLYFIVSSIFFIFAEGVDVENETVNGTLESLT